MSDNNSRTPQEKRKRVNRIKKGILYFLVIYFILTIIIIVSLINKVIALNKQIDSLNNNSNDSEVSNGVKTVDQSYNLASSSDTHKVYLTFEDGPSSTTSSVLDTLNQYNVKATFFVVGKEDSDSINIYKRIVNEGHTIGMHSYSHKYSTIYSSSSSFEKDLLKIQNLIYENTGVKSNLYRFPGGSNNKLCNDKNADFIKILNKNNINYVDWNVVSGDTSNSTYSTDDLVENIMTDVVKYKTSVVLLHDGENDTVTVEALPKIIESLQGINCEILPITEDTKLIQQIKLDK